MRLQRVAAYRELCRGVRRSGRENIVVRRRSCSFLAYIFLAERLPTSSSSSTASWSAANSLVGLFKWFFPSAEGHPARWDRAPRLRGLQSRDSKSSTFRPDDRLQPRCHPVRPAHPVSGAISRFKFYGQLRRLFADRPSAEHWRGSTTWCARSRPPTRRSDDLALDLPTQPALESQAARHDRVLRRREGEHGAGRGAG